MFVRGCDSEVQSSYPIPDHMSIGAAIGQHGRNVKYIEEQSGAACRVDKIQASPCDWVSR
jgi:hypothetical protein